MILHLVGFGTILYALDKLVMKEKREVKRRWKNIMQENGLINDKNRTFHIAKINQTEYGYLMIVSIPLGYSFEELEKKKEILESNLKGVIEMEHDKFNGWITMKIFKNPLKNLTFEPQPTKPHELYLGYTYNKHIIVDLNTLPHLLVAGINGSGKTRCLYSILTNLFHNHTEEEIEVYMSQIGKTDLLLFRQCSQIKKFTRTPEESLKMYRQLNSIMHDREQEIERLMSKGILNIEDYNKRMDKPMKYIYVVSDEFSLYMPDTTDSKAEKELKEQCLDILKKLIKLGRAYGIFVIMALQKTTNDQMPQLLKSQVNTKICFKQTDVYSSRNIIDCDDALKLKNREAILIADEKYSIKTPFINEAIIKKYISKACNVQSKPTVINLNFKPRQLQEDGIIRGDKTC